MDNPLRDPLRHNSWATQQLLDFCAGLSEDQLAATAPGAFGSIVATLRHIVSADGRYRTRLSGGVAPEWLVRDDELPGVEGLKACVADMASFWERWLEEPFDPDRPIETRGPDGVAHHTPAGVILAQALHHGNDHRDQVCTVITTLGLQPPDLQAWAYGLATGRIVPA